VSTRELLIKCGIASNRIHIVGCPKIFDKSQAKTHRAELSKLLRGKKYLVVWAPNPDNPFIVRIGFRSREVKTVISFARKHPDIAIVVRLHNRDQYATRFAKAFPGLKNVLVTTTIPLAELLQHSSVLLAFNTTAVSEGVLARVPVVALNLYGLPEIVPSVSKGVAIPCTSAAELEKILLDLLEGRTTIPGMVLQNYVRRELSHPQNKPALEAISDVVDKMLFGFE